jgi:hypothetical protein
MKTPKPETRYNFSNIPSRTLETFTRTATVGMSNHALNIIWALYDEIIAIRSRNETLEELNEALRESLKCKSSNGENDNAI